MSQDLNSQVSQDSGLNNPNKPITAAFDLETKIRVIIQEVLTATIRKVSQFHEKVETFQKFFFTYAQRINDMQEKGKSNEMSLIRIFDNVTKNKQSGESEMIKIAQNHEMLKIEKKQMEEEIKDLSKRLNTVTRQNQSINSEFSSTKKKFLQFSEQLNLVKEEVSWKITKYIEETAEVNTQIKISNQELKKQYFSVTLGLQKNQQKYQQIISTKDKQDSLNVQFAQTLRIVEEGMKDQIESGKNLNKKLEEMDTAVYAKIKLVESKIERKVEELTERVNQIGKAIGKVDGFAAILEDVKEQSELTRRQLLKKFEQTDQKHSDTLEKKMLMLNNQMLEHEKCIEKKLKRVTEQSEHHKLILTQRLDLIRSEIETELSSKTTRMMEQNTKSQSGIANSAVEILQQKINKVAIETKKSVTKIEGMVSQLQKDVNHSLQEVKEQVDSKIAGVVNAVEESNGSGVSPEFIQAINQKMETINLAFTQKFESFGKQLSQQNYLVTNLQKKKKQTQQKFEILQSENKQSFASLSEELSCKVERVMFTITKMRGDAIIRNQFIDKQMKEIKRTIDNTQKQLATFCRLCPAMGECINLIMCLIFDAEYQHAQLSTDNSQMFNKFQRKFQNLVEGVLYEYGEKRKVGCIIYRHKEHRKTDIVRDTLNGYIRVWEQAYDQWGGRGEGMPKGFYRKYVEAAPNQMQSEKQISGNYLPTIHNSKDKNKVISSQNNLGRSVDGDVMNKSYHIRKKRLSTIKGKDDLVIVLQEDLANGSGN